MNISHVESLGFRDSTSVSFEVDSLPTRHEEWAEAIDELPLEVLLGPINSTELNLVSHREESYEMSRKADGSLRRDWWAADHAWHIDGTPRIIQPAYTIIACKEAEQGSPDTQLLDMVRLTEVLEEDGFWERHGIDADDLAKMESIFANSTYYEQALPYMRSRASTDDAVQINEILQNDWSKAGVDDMVDFVAVMDSKYPPKAFPTLRHKPVKNLPAVFVDGGVKNSRLLSGDGLDHTDVLRALRQEYLTGYAPERRGLVKSIGWAANRCIIFPQVGTLHRAMPGNQHDRSLFLGFYVHKGDLEQGREDGN